MKSGTVYLVGAGPGDPGLITQKGLEALSRAEVIVYDNLIDEGLLELTPIEAERIFAGKSASVHIKEQSDINELLVQKALAGKTVVRLKGGDPFVLGRGGEEAEFLAANHIQFEVIPGITSAIAVPAYAGIPVTHRGIASSFAVITGHEDPTKEISGINWAQLATAVDTLVFLMGMQNLEAITVKLQEHGRNSRTPVAVIQNGTYPEQKTAVGTLQNIVERVKSQGLGSPAVIVVGEVVALREKLRWFDNRPLSGKRFLVTRSRHQAGALSRLLSARGAQPVEMPVIDIQNVSANPELDSAILNLPQYQWIFFTSANGIDSFFTRLRQMGLDARIFSGCKIGVIGPATAGKLEQHGLLADFCPEVFTTEGILVALQATGIRGKKVLLPRADIADQELVRGLSDLGAKVQQLTVYKTLPVSENATSIKALLQSGQIDVVTFTSSSTVANFMAALSGQEAKLSGVKVACIGPKTAAAATLAGLKVDILAREQTINGLVETMEEYFKTKMEEMP